jgi:hypothetical protein
MKCRCPYVNQIHNGAVIVGRSLGAAPPPQIFLCVKPLATNRANTQQTVVQQHFVL